MSIVFSRKFPPPPLATLRHPWRLLRNKAELLVAAIVLAHIGKLVVVGGYYGLFETWAPLTNAWHWLISDSSWRHLVRGVGEGLLGGTLAQLVVWSHYKKRPKPLNWLDKVELRLHIPNIKSPARLSARQFAVAPLLLAVYALPGFGLAAYAVHVLHLVAATPHGHLSFVQSLWTANYDQVLVGAFSSMFMARRPLAKVYDDVQLVFVERRLALSKKVRFYHPPTFRARYNDVIQQTRVAPRSPTALVPTLLSLSAVAGVLLAGLGYYVLRYVAH